MTKILIVEDDTIITKLYKRLFESENFEVVTALNGLEALDVATETKPQIILLDIMMPEMDGMQFIDEMKEKEDIKDIPIVVLTNLATGEDAKKALEKGVKKYIIKSDQEPREVVSVVQDVLGNGSE
jgi:CheY-like chemotaxis protein